MENIEISRPSENELNELGIAGWSPWECEPSTFEWEYGEEEWCFLFEGKADIKPAKGESVSIQKGDLVKFPKGLKCTWHVSEKVRKVYIFK
jgi:uncharacterized protein